ncbi:MAG TPA: hypothetical protein VH414_21830 [Lichenihabitans sp.]|jgi:hypothetical protein|nr:hypothetical protein [Lichenihabitans sp.]
MMRKPLLPLGFAAVCLLGLVVAALLGTRSVMHSYLGAWLIVLALPAGALPLAMGLEILPVDGLAIGSSLRRLLGLMPLAAVLALPVLLARRELFPDLGGATSGFAGAWNGTAFFVVRAILILLAWALLGVLFARPAARRRPMLAGFGLALHVVLVTLAAQDWILAVEPSFTSSAAGLLLLAAQSGMALAVAGLMSTRQSVSRAPDRLPAALAMTLAVWLFLAFTQYLVVWSANLPAEATWYRHRSADLGFGAEIAAGIICLVSLTVLPRAAARSSGLIAAVAALVALVHAGEMLWLVTPAIRGHFSVRLTDLLAVAGLVSLGLGFGRVFGAGTATGEIRRG